LFLKSFISITLVLTICFSGTFMRAFATETTKEDENIKLEDGFLSELTEWSPMETDGMYSISYFSTELPSITATNEVLWFDRLANKPSYAESFYDWLINNSKSGGALITAQEVMLSNGLSVHKVTTFSETVSFTFSYGATETQVKKAAADAIADDLETNFYVSSRWINEIMACFDRDYPEVFWLNGKIATSYGSSSSISYNSTACTGSVKYTQEIYYVLNGSDFDIRAEQYTTSSVITQDISARDNSANNIVTQTSGKSDYETIKYFNEYLTVNNGYNADLNNALPQAWECVSALQGIGGQKAPVCEGYARAFKVLCDMSDIPCVLVSGDAGGPHMWNYVQIEGTWYATDVTWNDPGRLQDGKPKSGYENENYLLVGSDTKVNGEKFYESHTVNNVVYSGGVAYLNEPEISAVSYATKIPHKCTHKNGQCTFCGIETEDINRDSVVNISDLVRLKTAVLNEEDMGNFDCNDDGIINGLDLNLIRRLIWNAF